MSTLFLRTLREDPADADVTSHKLLVRAGYIRRAAPGIYTWLPLGLRVLGKIEQIVREEMAAIGGQEVHFPALLPREPYEATGRWEEYGPALFRLKDRKEADYLLAPTHEEMFTLLVRDMYSSYKDLPAILYQIQTKYRDEARPRAGVLRGREFVMKDSYSFDLDEDQLEESYLAHRGAYQRIFTRLGLDYVIVAAESGAMGGSRSEEFLHPCPIGEDTFARSAGGYAANVEAVRTPQAEPLDASGIGAPQLMDTPDTPTIESLVEVANQHYPRPDRAWTAADTLKNVALAVTAPDGERQVCVVGLPGDRQVDEKRLEAAFYPATVEQATAEDLQRHPELVAGYIGPRSLGPNGPARDENGQGGAVRYLLDPRVAEGSAWITGADETGKHVLNLVAGRDFTADGVVDVAEVHSGDAAPDGSGPLELQRGLELGHIFALGRKYAEALDLTVLDQNGKTTTVTMGSYGFGVTRVLAAIAESTSDEQGLAWPVAVAPAHVHVLATGKDEDVFTTAEQLAGELEAAGLDVLYDDRRKVSAGVKFADSELLGMPFGLVVGRSLAQGKVEIRRRAGGDREEVAPDEAVQRLQELIQQA